MGQLTHIHLVDKRWTHISSQLDSIIYFISFEQYTKTAVPSFQVASFHQINVWTSFIIYIGGYSLGSIF